MGLGVETTQQHPILNGGTIVDHPHNDCISRLISHEFPPLIELQPILDQDQWVSHEEKSRK